MEETKYILVEWPEYQYYMDDEDTYFCAEANVLFVPEETYNNKFKSEE